MNFSVLLISFFTIFLFNSCHESKEKTNVKNPPKKSKYVMTIGESCSFDRPLDKSNVYSFKSDSEAENAIKNIMRLTGLPPNFEIKAANIPNACAVIFNKKRYILYNQEFMEKIKDDTKTHYSELAILAHEIGHHLAGHTLSEKGSSYDFELEADKFSGFILSKMDAPLDEAKRAYYKLPNEGSLTHPPRSARIAAFVNGYLAAGNKENINSKNIYTPDGDKGTDEKKVVVKNNSSSKDPQLIDIKLRNSIIEAGECNCTESALYGYIEDLTMRVTFNSEDKNDVDFQHNLNYQVILSKNVTLDSGESYNRIIFLVTDGSNKIGCKGCKTNYDLKLLKAIRINY